MDELVNLLLCRNSGLNLVITDSGLNELWSIVYGRPARTEDTVTNRDKVIVIVPGHAIFSRPKGIWKKPYKNVNLALQALKFGMAKVNLLQSQIMLEFGRRTMFYQICLIAIRQRFGILLKSTKTETKSLPLIFMYVQWYGPYYMDHIIWFIIWSISYRTVKDIGHFAC